MKRPNISRFIPKSAFLRNVGVLTGGTMFAQGLAIVALPILTRLYTPDEFGVLSVYVALIGLLSVVSCLRFNIAVPLPEQDEDAINLLALAMTSATLISTLLLVIILAVPTQISAQLGQPKLEPFLWMIPAGVFLASAYNAVQYWSTRKQRFLLVTRTRMTRAIGGAGIQLGYGLAWGGPFGLLLGHMMYGGLGVVGLVRDLLRTDRILLKAISVQAATKVFWTYIHFPTRSVPAAILNAGYQYLPILVMAAAIGEARIGMLFLVTRALATPVSLVGSSISQVYLAESTKLLSENTLGAFTRKIMKRLFFIGAPALIAVGGIAYLFFGIIFGESYSDAGSMAVWMVPWFIVQLIASPVSGIFTIVNRQTYWMVLQAVGFIMIVGGTFAVTRIAPEITIEAYAIINFAFYALVCAVILRQTKQSQISRYYI